jgi:hypothetical protein
LFLFPLHDFPLFANNPAVFAVSGSALIL